jgi:hypothetical protein
MSATKKTAPVIIAGLIALGAFELGEQLAVPGVHSAISSAEARVGRPLTPVSVAGVARRSVRRCAVGVYNC